MSTEDITELQGWQRELEHEQHFKRKEGVSDAGYPMPLGRLTEFTRTAERRARLLAKVLREIKST